MKTLKTERIPIKKLHKLRLTIIVLLALTGCATAYKQSAKQEKEMTFTLIPEKEGADIGLAGSGKATIQWGDGKSDKIKLSTKSKYTAHLYSDSSFYTIVIRGKNIRMLGCNHQGIIHLDVSNNLALEKLYCAQNKLTNLDVSKNAALKELFCAENKLTVTDVSNNLALTGLWNYGNRLTNLDISKNTALTILTCDDNPLKSLDVSKNRALQHLNCSANQLTSLDVSQNTALVKLICTNDSLTVLDISQNTALMNIVCLHNRLTDLDVSNNPALAALDCSDNNFSETALNMIFGALNDRKFKGTVIGFSANQKVICVGENPGAAYCNKSIAEKKGWRVIAE